MSEHPREVHDRRLAPDWKIRPTTRRGRISQALAWLRTAGVPYDCPTPHHIKIGALNFYPTTGTLHFDQESSLPERGLIGLRSVLGRRLRRELPPIDEMLGE